MYPAEVELFEPAIVVVIACELLAILVALVEVLVLDEGLVELLEFVIALDELMDDEADEVLDIKLVDEPVVLEVKLNVEDILVLTVLAFVIVDVG